MIYLCILFVLDKHTRHHAIVLCFNCLVITAGTMRSDIFCERYTDHFHKKGQQLNRTKSQRAVLLQNHRLQNYASLTLSWPVPSSAVKPIKHWVGKVISTRVR